MEHSIGVGIIVGLTVASSLYIWNSESFSKAQKTVLLVFLIIPPAQWLGILLVLVFNNYKASDSTEKITERKVEQIKSSLDNSISNLTDLKEKGILTDEEYKSKVEKLEAEKDEQNLKSSVEYKQLKSLFDSGVLTKEEFEKKVKILNSNANQGLKNQINKSSGNFTEDENTSKKTLKKSNSLTYIVVVVILIIIASLINWNEVLGEIENYKNHSNEEVINEPAIDSSAVAIDNSDNSNIVNNFQKKFVYIVITAKEPKLIHSDGIYLSSGVGGFSSKTEDIDYVDYETSTYSTEIKEISDYNEDTKNMLLDKTEYDVKQRMNMSSNFQTDLFIKCKDENKRSTLKENYPKIIDRQIYAFDTYTDASLDKQANNNLNN